MASLLSLINRLLPFATPGTPLTQDLLHLAAICTLLYFAPQIQERIQSSNRQTPEDAQHRAPSQEQQAQPQEDEPRPAQPPAEDDVPPNDNPVPDTFPEQEPPLDPEDHGPQPGRIDQPPAPTHRNVGAKKAKSLQRRDQRRAYHEFQRSQGDAQRAADASTAKEREAAQAAERERRREIEAKVEAKKAEEREAKRRREREEWEGEVRRREEVLATVRAEVERVGACDLWKVAARVDGDVSGEWVEKVVRGSTGILGRIREGAVTILTEMGWVVRVEREVVEGVYRSLAEDETVGDGDGRVGFEEVGAALQKAIGV